MVVETGTDIGETLTGTDLADTLDSAGGNDIIFGLDGADSLIGGLGADSIDGGDGNDEIIGTGPIAEVDPPSVGPDTLIGGAGEDTILGFGNNVIADGGSGNDNIQGGPDGLSDTLDGGTGDDTLIGQGGADVYIVDSLLDFVADFTYDSYGPGNTATGDVDEIRSTISWVLRDWNDDGFNVENLTLLGSADIDATGNEVGNVVTGNGGDNQLFGLANDDTLDGGAGNDTIEGGTGDDLMTGGDGADTFVINALSGNDTITDFVSHVGTDVLSTDFLDFSAFTQAQIDSQVLSQDADGNRIISTGGSSVTLLGVSNEEVTVFSKLAISTEGSDLNLRKIIFKDDDTDPNDDKATLEINGPNDVTLKSLDVSDPEILVIAVDQNTHPGVLTATGGSPAFYGGTTTELLTLLGSADSAVWYGYEHVPDIDPVTAGDQPGYVLHTDGTNPYAGIDGEALSTVDATMHEGYVNLGVAAKVDREDFRVDNSGSAGTVALILGKAILEDGTLEAPELSATGVWSFINSKTGVTEDASGSPIDPTGGVGDGGMTVTIKDATFLAGGQLNLFYADLDIMGAVDLSALGADGLKVWTAAAGDDVKGSIRVLEGSTLILSVEQVEYLDDVLPTGISISGSGTIRVVGDGTNTTTDFSVLQSLNVDFSGVTLDLGTDVDGKLDVNLDGGFDDTVDTLTEYVTGGPTHGQSLTGSAFNDQVNGGLGADSLNGGAGDDTLNGGLGDDTIRAGLEDDSIRGGAGIDTAILAVARSDATVGIETNGIRVFSSQGNDSIHEDVENIVFLDGSVTYGDLRSSGGLIVNGTEAAENVNGTAAAEIINALGGSDWITPGGGNDTINGGAGRDMLSFVNLPDTPGRTNVEYRLDIDMGAGTAVSHDGLENIQFSNVERITGTIFADRIKGDAGDNQLRGLGDFDWFVATEGNDSYEGGTGQDMISYVGWQSTAVNTGSPFNPGGAPPANAQVTGVVVDLTNPANNTNLAAGDVYDSVERITGSGRQDVFYGDGSQNDFRGLGDFDWFVGSSGGRERYFGGDGDDTVTYFQSTSGVTASLRNGAIVNGEETGRGTRGDAALDLYFEIEGLVGTNFADHLTGNSGRNNLSGLEGDDFLFGFGGIDRLKGGAGNDMIDGGGSSDFAVYDGDRADFTITRTASRDATVSGGTAGTDTLINIENFVFDDQTVSIFDLVIV